MICPILLARFSPETKNATHMEHIWPLLTIGLMGESGKGVANSGFSMRGDSRRFQGFSRGVNLSLSDARILSSGIITEARTANLKTGNISSHLSEYVIR